MANFSVRNIPAIRVDNPQLAEAIDDLRNQIDALMNQVDALSTAITTVGQQVVDLQNRIGS
jgi:peptidoglycan hydrolase CwlO-like protein